MTDALPTPHPLPASEAEAAAGPAASAMPAGIALREAIRTEGQRLGLARVGFTTAEPLAGADERRWQRWHARDARDDLAGVMLWLRRATPRRTHPRDLLPTAQSAIVVLAGYYQGDHPPPPAELPAGKVARYAWGADYHHVLRERLEQLAAFIRRQAEVPDAAFRMCVDSAPLDERALAVRAGLGFLGKNTLLLDPQRGSWHVIGVLLTSLPLPPDAPLRSPAATCGTCRRCLEACPTGALSAPWQLEPRRCLSYATIEDRGPLPSELRERLGGWTFGCDICQEVCPFNAMPQVVQVEGLRAAAGCGPWLGVRELGAVGSRAFRRRWQHSPIARAGLVKLRDLLQIHETAGEKSVSGKKINGKPDG